MASHIPIRYTLYLVVFSFISIFNYSVNHSFSHSFIALLFERSLHLITIYYPYAFRELNELRKYANYICQHPVACIICHHMKIVRPSVI